MTMTAQHLDHAQAGQARARMRTMIDRLRAASAPPWKQQIDAILDDGVFRRAIRLIPTEKSEALWAEFDTQRERLTLMWDQTDRDGRPRAASP